MIPSIDIAPLFGSPGPAQTKTDRAIYRAAGEVGFMCIYGTPYVEELSLARRKSLLRLFKLPEFERRKLWKKNFAPENPNLYRGLFPLHSGKTLCREGFEIGPDAIRELPMPDPPDLLCEPSVFPSADLLPDWHSHAADFYRSMEFIGQKILASLSRGLGIDEEIFADAFRDGISTLRLLRYPERDLSSDVGNDLPPNLLRIADRIFEIVAGAHVDTGLLTVLADYEVPGLQAQSDSGDWVDVTIPSNGLAINFGGLLSRWTGRRIRATRHRVLSSGEERFSIPFFFEPRPNTVIAPLPISNAEAFPPFLFGDHLWATTTKFPENYGLGRLRPPRAAYRNPWVDSQEY